MPNTKKNKKSKTEKQQLENPVASGKKAIEADKKINKQDKSQQQKEKEEKADAEQWRNEG